MSVLIAIGKRKVLEEEEKRFGHRMFEQGVHFDLIGLELEEEISELDGEFLNQVVLPHAFGIRHQLEGVGKVDAVGFRNDLYEGFKKRVSQ